MYIIHNDTFLPEIVDISIAYGVVMSDHFPLIFEFSQCSMSSFSQILRKPPLTFNFPLLQHQIFNSYMSHLTNDFSNSVERDCYNAWAIFLNNVQKLCRYYGIHNAYQKRHMLCALVSLIENCNSLLLMWSNDKDLLEIQSILSSTIIDVKFRINNRCKCIR